MWRINSGAVNEYFLERARQPGWIARKLHRGGVGQDFALPTNGGLDQSPKEDACPTDDNEGQTNYRNWKLASSRLNEDPTDNRQAENPENQAHEAQIEPHIAIKNVAELVSDYSL